MKLCINNQHIKIIKTKGGYRSWTIEYSHGLMQKADGKWKNLWHWPTYHHVDVRAISVASNDDTEETPSQSALDELKRSRRGDDVAG